jgi:NADH-quinone oxidoreductase subunit H
MKPFDPFELAGQWLQTLLLGWNLDPVVVNGILTFLAVFLVANFCMLYIIFLIWLERKLAARMQDRLGPNRVGKYGLAQTVADILKLFTKEDTTPAGADKVIFNLAPIMAVVSVLLIWAVIPFSETWFGTDINVGVLYIIAVGSIGVLATLIAGWSSNNKFALLGAFRTVAQLVSYEVPMILALLIPVLLAGSMGVHEIVNEQAGFFGAYFWAAPIAALMFFVSSIAEVGRTPFDLLEAESEIVAGFHIEYSGAKFAMIFAAEFLHAFTISVLTATMFFGGWRGPGADISPLIGFFWFMVKAMTVYFVVAWIRTTLPRIRIDHMLNINWKFLTPLALVVLIVTALVRAGLGPQGADVSQGIQFAALFIANLVMIAITVRILQHRNTNRPARVKVGDPRPVARPPEPVETPAEA